MNTIRPNTTTRLLTAGQMSAEHEADLKRLRDRTEIVVLAVALVAMMAAVVVGGWLMAPGTWLS